MAYYNGRSYTDLRGLNLKADNGAIRFATPTTTPSTTSGERLLYVNSSNQLIFDDGSSTTTLGASGVVSSFSLNDAYDDGRTITVDAGAVVLAGASEATAVLSITADGGSSGAGILIANSGSGNDVTGTSSTWSVSAAGAAVFTGVTMADSQAITLGTGSDATIQWDGSVLNIAGVTDFDNNVTLAANATITQTGVAGSTVYTITAGDVVWSDTSLALTDADNAESVTIINNTATTIGAAASAGVVQIESTSLTTGAALNVQLTEGTLNGGFYYSAWDATGGSRVFSVGENGATVIAGGGGTDNLTVTAGDVNLVDGSITLVDADNAVSLSVTNDTATTSDVVMFAGSGTFTGTGASAFVQVVPSGLTTGDAFSITADAMTTGTALLLSSSGTLTTTGAMLEVVADSATTAAGLIRASADGLTTGDVLNITCTAGNALTTGELLDISHVSGNITGTLNKTGNMNSFVSTRTVTTGTVADNFDMLSATRTSVINGAGTFSSTGSVARLENAVTNTSGTVTDTVIGLEVLMDSLGTGDGIQVTHAATAGVALDVIGAATTVSDVTITTTGAKADNKAALEVLNNAATAAGGSILRVTNTGTPAAATSYLVDFDYTGATFTNNPDGVHIASAGTGRALHVTSSGLAAVGSPSVDIESTNGGAVGAVLRLFHQGGGQGANDVVGAITFTGEDDAQADNEYGRIEAAATAVAAGSEAGALDFYAGDGNGGVSKAFRATHDGSNGFISAGDGAATGIVESNGNFDLQLQTGNSTTGTIAITDGANGNITLTPNGSGQVDIANVMLYSKTQAITGAGAIDVVSSITELNTTGGGAYTLADGTEGQVKFIVMDVDSGTDAVITPSNLAGGSTITFADQGDGCVLLFTSGEWFILGNNGGTIA